MSRCKKSPMSSISEENSGLSKLGQRGNSKSGRQGQGVAREASGQEARRLGVSARSGKGKAAAKPVGVDKRGTRKRAPAVAPSGGGLRSPRLQPSQLMTRGGKRNVCRVV